MKKVCRVLALCLVVCLLFLTSCGNTYPPEKSTKEESATVLQLTYGKKTYNVPMELYRAFYLTYADDATGDELTERVYDRITDMYAVFALCDAYKVKYEDRTADEIVEECIRDAIEGNGIDTGYGTYEAFLAALKEEHLNYAVFDRICRYTLAEERLNDYLFGVLDEYSGIVSDAHRTVTEDEARAYLESDDTARVLMAKLIKRGFTEARVQELYAGLCDAVRTAAPGTEEEAAANYLIGHTAAVGNEIEDGVWISRYNLDRSTYGDLADAVLATEEGSVMPLSLFYDGEEEAYFLVYRTAVPAELLNAPTDAVYEAVRAEIFGKTIAEAQAALRESLTVVSLPDLSGEIS